MKSICVFCGSRDGNETVYSKEAERLGKLITKNNLTLIYGGGKVGLMGIIANAVLKSGGRVIGVIPQFLLDKEVGHKGLTELMIVDSMHERKTKMSQLADGFIAMPGGFGTLEELAEIITWNQLDLLTKPVGLLNTNGFYGHLISFFDHTVNQGFVNASFRAKIYDNMDPEVLIQDMLSHTYVAKKDDLSKS